MEIPAWCGVFRAWHLLLLDETWVEFFVNASGVTSRIHTSKKRQRHASIMSTASSHSARIFTLPFSCDPPIIIVLLDWYQGTLVANFCHWQKSNEFSWSTTYTHLLGNAPVTRHLFVSIDGTSVSQWSVPQTITTTSQAYTVENVHVYIPPSVKSCGDNGTEIHDVRQPFSHHWCLLTHCKCRQWVTIDSRCALCG